MKRLIPFLLTAMIAAICGWFGARCFPHAARSDGHGVADKLTSNQCPMHPWVKSDKPGDCTICGMDLVAIQDGGTMTTHAVDGIVMLPPGSPNVIGVQVREVKKQRLVRTLRVAGMMGEDESRHAVISAPVEGRIDGLSMNHEGQPVARRQPIATIFSRTLLDAADDYKKAISQGGAALLQARQKLERYGLVAEQIATIPDRQPDDVYFGLLSSHGGIIVKSYVSEGQYVKAGDKLFELADFTRMWCMFTVYEQDLSLVRERQIVTVRTASLPGQEFKGRVGFISPNFDEATRAARVRVVIENPERRLRNNAFVEGVIEVDAPEVLAVPRSAVLFAGGSSRVYVETASGSYQQRAVKLGRAGDVLWEVIDGLREGERVVASGSMLIDSQSQINGLAMSAESEGAAAVESANPAALREFMHAVAGLNVALASDDLAAANTALKLLPAPPVGLITCAAPGTNTDIKELRKAFLPWSQEVAALAIKMRVALPEVHVFRCPMTKQLWPGAPANAGWIQLGMALQNPYWGKEMLECGVEVK
jgi:Cu(I)/Ag(I) efflux system membrane fusion protein